MAAIVWKAAVDADMVQMSSSIVNLQEEVAVMNIAKESNQSRILALEIREEASRQATTDMLKSQKELTEAVNELVVSVTRLQTVIDIERERK